jgi:hypothetical protein
MNDLQKSKNLKLLSLAMDNDEIKLKKFFSSSFTDLFGNLNKNDRFLFIDFFTRQVQVYPVLSTEESLIVMENFIKDEDKNIRFIIQKCLIKMAMANNSLAEKVYKLLTSIKAEDQAIPYRKHYDIPEEELPEQKTEVINLKDFEKQKGK